MRMQFFSILTTLGVVTFGALAALGQQQGRSFPVAAGVRVEIVNHFGRVSASVNDGAQHAERSSDDPAVFLDTASADGVSVSDLKINASRSLVQIEVAPSDAKKRIDLSLTVPPRTHLKIETREGEVRIGGDIASADVRTATGTIAADVPTEHVRYSLLWTASRPRFLSDFELEKIKEKSGGKFRIDGTYSDVPPANADEAALIQRGEKRDPEGTSDARVGEKSRKEKIDRKAERVSLDLETARGIILLNIPPNEVTGDLRERPLTNAAKSIIRSGDSLLMEAIRRAVPRYYGDYLRTLPPLKMEPRFAERKKIEDPGYSGLKVASVRVSDVNNRAVGDLTAADFEVSEGGAEREVVSVRPSTAPFNLVLLLDVSGSVENYVNFIRKAARSFVNTVDSRDRIAIVTFNDDVHIVSKFTTDKGALSMSLDTFDAGGATAYYDALAYTLAETLRPLKGERTAIVVLTDGDDNRSFLPFDSMLSSIEESGALIYPLYVPSALIAASGGDSKADIDSLRSRYLRGELTSKAKAEGGRLAKVSGGVYYEISKLSEIQAAYEDIVGQLRTAYEIEYRSDPGSLEAGVSPRLRIRTKHPNTYVQVRAVEQRSAAK
ncbi:MAG: VWA domain-containing protein [Acidobacteria bacterium]|nr:VWA domain-containing protein [Acidobacteriota bacterium]